MTAYQVCFESRKREVEITVDRDFFGGKRTRNVKGGEGRDSVRQTSDLFAVLDFEVLSEWNEIEIVTKFPRGEGDPSEIPKITS